MFTISVDNIAVDKNKVAYNSGLNFNQFDENLTVKKFEIKISRSAFLAKLNDIYDVVKTEIKIDDDMYNDTSEFSKVNYCSLEELLDKPKSLFEIFTTYLTDAFFVNFQSESAKYVINSITEIEIKDQISITGEVFVKK